MELFDYSASAQSAMETFPLVGVLRRPGNIGKTRGTLRSGNLTDRLSLTGSGRSRGRRSSPECCVCRSIVFERANLKNAVPDRDAREETPNHSASGNFPLVRSGPFEQLAGMANFGHRLLRSAGQNRQVPHLASGSRFQLTVQVDLHILQTAHRAAPVRRLRFPKIPQQVQHGRRAEEIRGPERQTARAPTAARTDR